MEDWGWEEFDRSFLPTIDRACDEHGDKVCLQFRDESYTYAEVGVLSAKIANALLAHGFEPQMKGAVYSHNSAAGFLATLGLIRAGGTWLPVNPRNAPAVNVNGIIRFGCGAAFYQGQFRSSIDEARQRLGELRLTVSLDDEVGSGDPFLWDWIGDAPPTPPRLDVAGRDLLSIPTTGGTTGIPKGVMLSHRNFNALSHGMTLRYAGRLPVILCAAPMSHVGGRIALASMASGARLVVMEKVEPQSILRAIERERITDFFLPPTALYALLDQPNVGEFDLSSLVSVSYGSAPMAVDRIRQALDVFGPVLRGGFGQTESPMFITCLAPHEHYVDGDVSGPVVDDDVLRSVGSATELSQVAIVDNSGLPVPPGERGEIAVKGPMVSEGYYRDPEETARVRVNGWHLTGDIGFVDEHGYVHIVDRKKDMIITGGFNVYSAEVEQALLAIDGIRQAAVIGVPSDKWGEEVKAVVQLVPGAGLTAEEIITQTKAMLGSVMAPKSVEIVEDLPATAVGKIDKKALRQRYDQSATGTSVG